MVLKSFELFSSRWSTTDLQAQSKMLINNTGIKSSNILVTVRQGSFDAHGGIVGGYIDVGNITAKGNPMLYVRDRIIIHFGMPFVIAS